jgi:hypothetical protein
MNIKKEKEKGKEKRIQLSEGVIHEGIKHALGI